MAKWNEAIVSSTCLFCSYIKLPKVSWTEGEIEATDVKT